MITEGFQCTVVDSVEAPEGKWPDALGGVVALDSQHLSLPGKWRLSEVSA